MRVKPALFLLTFVILGCSSQAGTETRVSSSAVVAAPDFVLTDTQGQKFSLKDFRGKVVFLDFWATWCPPCVISVPEVEKLHDDYTGKNVEVISISLDQDTGSVHRFVKNHNMRNRVAMVQNSGVDEKYRVGGIPAFFLINQEGKIVNVWEGYHPRMVALWRKELDRLLQL